jgi:tripartite-type tricarboxylate transporter receptor subunit TctC
VSNQPADGYTLFVGASGVMSIASAVFPKLAYHPTKSFIPLSMIANFPLILVSPVENPAKTVTELVAFAKANPGKSNYGTTSPAFTISTELLKLKTGMPGIAIPLKSSNEMILCVMQQQCLLSISDGPPAIPQINAGKVRALAVTGSERSPQLPNVPSMAEAGLPEVNTKLWSGFFVPAKTPPAIAAKLEAALRKAITDPGVSAKLREMAVTPGGTASADFRKMIDADIQNYVAVVKAANLEFK